MYEKSNRVCSLFKTARESNEEREVVANIAICTGQYDKGNVIVRAYTTKEEKVPDVQRTFFLFVLKAPDSSLTLVVRVSPRRSLTYHFLLSHFI